MLNYRLDARFYICRSNISEDTILNWLENMNYTYRFSYRCRCCYQRNLWGFKEFYFLLVFLNYLASTVKEEHIVRSFVRAFFCTSNLLRVIHSYVESWAFIQIYYVIWYDGMFSCGFKYNWDFVRHYHTHPKWVYICKSTNIIKSCLQIFTRAKLGWQHILCSV